MHEPQTPTAGVCATKTKEQTGNVDENKGTCKIVGDRGSADHRFCGPRLFSGPSTNRRPQQRGVCATKTKEQTGNVYENKGARQIVGDGGSANRRFCGPRLFSGLCTSRRPQQRGSALRKRRNKPGMSMKTKETVKKSRAECESKVE